MRIKEFRADVKAASDDAGTFEALVSVFGNIDDVGDKVMPGAFTKTLAEWTESGDPIPVVWSHRWDDPFAHIGHVIEAKETDRGLYVKGAMDLDNPSAAQVHRLLKARRVKQFSFAYDIPDGGSALVEPDEGRPFVELRELKVHEVGPTLLGANRETDLIAAKAAVLQAGAKAGRVLSQKNFEKLKSAHEAIGTVLTAAEPEKTSDPAGVGENPKPSQSDAPSPDEDPARGKSVPTVTAAPRRALAVARIRNL